MQKLVKDGVVVNNAWVVLEKSDNVSMAVPAGNTIIPLSLWLQQKAVLSNRDDIGVWIDSDEDVAELSDDINALPLIAVNFPVFADGRGFSTARLLRERYNFAGELRAIGSFIRDQLCYLRRCGVNAFQFTDESIDLGEAVKSLNDFSEYYQTAVDQPVPLFRRRKV